MVENPDMARGACGQNSQFEIFKNKKISTNNEICSYTEHIYKKGNRTNMCNGPITQHTM